MKGISVILCSFNGAARLGATLDHLARQATAGVPAWELIFVDNASTDGSATVVRDLWRAKGGTIPLIIKAEPRQGLVYARQTGVGASRYDIIVFCDDDNWLDAGYLSAAFDIMEADPTIGALGGVGTPISDVTLPQWFEKYKYSFACYAQGTHEGELAEQNATLFGAGLVLRREVWDRLFNSDFQPVLTDRRGTKLISGGDTELSFATKLLGYKLWFSPRLQFFHYMPAARLSTDYLLRLNEALSFSSASLIVYRYALQGKTATSLVWMKDLAYQLWLFSNALVRYFDPGRPALERRLGIGFSYQSLRGVMMQFGKYRSRYRNIVRLSNPVR